jgi:hypothetical protein
MLALGRSTIATYAADLRLARKVIAESGLSGRTIVATTSALRAEIG